MSRLSPDAVREQLRLVYEQLRLVYEQMELCSAMLCGQDVEPVMSDSISLELFYRCKRMAYEKAYVEKAMCSQNCEKIFYLLFLD